MLKYSCLNGKPHFRYECIYCNRVEEIDPKNEDEFSNWLDGQIEHERNCLTRAGKIDLKKAS